MVKKIKNLPHNNGARPERTSPTVHIFRGRKKSIDKKSRNKNQTEQSISGTQTQNAKNGKQRYERTASKNRQN